MIDDMTDDAIDENVGEMPTFQRTPRKRRADKTPAGQASVAGTANDNVKPKRATAADKLKQQYTELYFSLGILIYPFEQFDGMTIMQNASKRADELVNVARHHPQMLRVMKQIVASNDYVVLAVGYGSMAATILAHHKLLPFNIPVFAAPDGVSPGDAEEQARAGVEQMAHVMDAMRPSPLG